MARVDFDVLNGGGQIGLGILQRDLEGLGIEGEENIARCDRLAFADIDRLHQTRHVGGDHQLVGMDIGIVGVT